MKEIIDLYRKDFSIHDDLFMFLNKNKNIDFLTASNDKTKFENSENFKGLNYLVTGNKAIYLI